MILSVRQLKNYKVLDIGEPMRKYEDINSIKDKIDELLDSNETFIALNVTNIDYMHSFFIKILTSTYKKLKSHNGDLCLIGPNEFLRNLMKILNIEEYINVYRNEAAFREILNLPPLS